MLKEHEAPFVLPFVLTTCTIVDFVQFEQLERIFFVLMVCEVEAKMFEARDRVGFSLVIKEGASLLQVASPSMMLALFVSVYRFSFL